MGVDLRLVSPGLEWAAAFLDMNEELRRGGDRQYRASVSASSFEAFLGDLRAMEERVVPDGLVPMSIFWLVDGSGRILGEVRFRHYLNEGLMVEGGNIGYHIRPSERRKGYGTAILQLMLAVARERGYERVLVTCDTDNIPSARIIEGNGGVLDGYGISDDSGKQVSRYWIDL